MGRQAIVEAPPQSLIRLTLHAGGKHDASASPVVPTDPPQAEGNMKGKRREHEGQAEGNMSKRGESLLF